MRQNDPVRDSDELVAVIDQLMAAGSQHVNLEIGEEMHVKTVNSTECGGKPGACAVPNFDANDEDESESEEESDDEQF